MKTILPLFFLGTCMAVQAANTVTEDFSNGIGKFTPLNTTNVDTSSGALEIDNPGGQGSGAFVDLSTTLGMNLSSFLLNSDGTPNGESLFFQFSTKILEGTDAFDEIAFFLGPVPNQAQTSSITNGQNNNAFTLFINDEELFAQNNQAQNNPNSVSNGTNGEVGILSGLGIGSELTINLEWSLVQGANNALASIYTVTANGVDSSGAAISGTGMFDGAQQNLSANLIDSFGFVVTATEELTGTIDDFILSDMPISIPEPSTLFLSLLGLPALFLRRRHHA